MEREFDKDFDLLLAATVEIGNALEGQTFQDDEKYLYYAEGLGKKIIGHLVSVWRLHQAFVLQIGENRYQQEIDFGSVAVLARSAIETYLVFHHIFLDTPTPALRDLRYMAWDLAGFLERTNMPASSEAHLKKQADEKQSIESLTTRLKALPEFQSLTTDEQKLIIKGKWRMNATWTMLAVRAGFNEKYFQRQYKFLCSYAHSGRLSVLQIRQLNEFSSQQNMSNAFIGTLLIFMAKFANDYIKAIPHFQHVTVDAGHLQLIKLWNIVADNLQKQPVREN